MQSSSTFTRKSDSVPEAVLSSASRDIVPPLPWMGAPVLPGFGRSGYFVSSGKNYVVTAASAVVRPSFLGRRFVWSGRSRPLPFALSCRAQSKLRRLSGV